MPNPLFFCMIWKPTSLTLTFHECSVRYGLGAGRAARISASRGLLRAAPAPETVHRG